MYLNCHSCYSLRYGTIDVKELILTARQAGVEALALTDINSATGAFDFAKMCGQAGIKPIIGIDFRNQGRKLYVGLAKNNEGFREMNELLTKHFEDKTDLPTRAPEFQHCHVIYPLEQAPKNLRENEYVGVRIDQRNLLIRSRYKDLKHKLVILQPVTVQSKAHHNLHRLLRCIDYNIILSKLPVTDHCQPDEVILPIDQLLEYFKDFPHLIINTSKLLDDCNFEFEFNVYRNKKHYTGSKYSDKLLLERLVKDGFEFRYKKENKEAWGRVKKELAIIDSLGFGGYFLCTWDIIRHSLSRGLYHVGRGSGANSIVAYILKITNVCPISLDLYFERFLNPSRQKPPDFDIDWGWQDRDEILDYIFTRFDADCTAFCGTISEFKHRSIHRELGKVLGLPKSEIDQLTGAPRELHDGNSIVKAIHKYGAMLSRFPNQRSMHACGVIISEKPLTYYSAMTMPPKGFRTLQFDMYIAEDIGFEKFDILSQRGLGTIHSCIEMVKENQGEKIDFNDTDLYLDNPRCNEMLSKGLTIGCFYIESPAMRGLLRRLNANNYRILVAASSVIRPGVAKSGMLREFQRRHNFPNDFEYFHPVFEEHLGETYGVMVYQEDVIKIAHHFAGLDMADGDILRRGMSGKTRSSKEMDRIKEKFFRNCKAKGYSDELAGEVYRQIESFAGYSFCKSHSASYAIESYLALYLKTFYPLEFMVSCINNFGGFYRTEIYFHEARMAGGEISPPCVNRSERLTTLSGKHIVMGFVHIEGFNKKTGNAILAERQENGPFQSLEEFMQRMPIGLEHLQVLIFVGAFAFTGQSKNELILNCRLMFSKDDNKVKNLKLFQPQTKKFEFPKLDRERFEDAFDEIELLHFAVRDTPFDMLKTKYRGNVLVDQLLTKENQTVRLVAYLIAIKHVPTARGNMNFGTWIDSSGVYFDTTHFPEQLKAYPFKGAGCYLIQGKVAVEFGFPTIEVEKQDKLPMIEDPRYSDPASKVQLPEGHNTSPRPLTRAPYPSQKEVADKFTPAKTKNNNQGGLQRYKMKDAF